MTDVAPTPTYRIAGPGVAWRETGGEIVVLDVASSVYYGLNPTATTLWRQLAGGATGGELAQALRHTAGIPEERAACDVRAFLEELRASGLLVEVSAQQG